MEYTGNKAGSDIQTSNRERIIKAVTALLETSLGSMEEPFLRDFSIDVLSQNKTLQINIAEKTK